MIAADGRQLNGNRHAMGRLAKQMDASYRRRRSDLWERPQARRSTIGPAIYYMPDGRLGTGSRTTRFPEFNSDNSSIRFNESRRSCPNTPLKNRPSAAAWDYPFDNEFLSISTVP